MDIRLASALELPILESLAREIWPDTYADIISRDQMDFMLNWMYSTETLEKQQADGHEFYLIRHDYVVIVSKRNDAHENQRQ